MKSNWRSVLCLPNASPGSPSRPSCPGAGASDSPDLGPRWRRRSPSPGRSGSRSSSPPTTRDQSSSRATGPLFSRRPSGPLRALTEERSASVRAMAWAPATRRWKHTTGGAVLLGRSREPSRQAAWRPRRLGGRPTGRLQQAAGPEGPFAQPESIGATRPSRHGFDLIARVTRPTRATWWLRPWFGTPSRSHGHYSTTPPTPALPRKGHLPVSRPQRGYCRCDPPSRRIAGSLP